MQKILPKCSAPLLRSSTASALRATRIVHRSINPAHNVLHPARPVSRSFHQITSLRQNAAAAAPADTTQDAGNLASTFAELGERKLVSRQLVDTLTNSMNVHTMTDVQKATINTALSGKDLIAQARTGTGKTLAFLLPIVQNVLREDPSLEQPQRRKLRSGAAGSDIRALIISPTRELAEQIAVEAKNLVRGTGVMVQTAVGGSFKREGLRRMQQDGCHILVGTPGRLEDIMSDTYSGISVTALNTLVLDEADRLLETGFAEAIKTITSYLPSPQQRDRQTMMFSATVPREVVRLVRQTLKPGFEFVQCVKEGEEPTHERVPQKFVEVKGFENKIPVLLELLARAAKEGQQPGGRPLKAIVYFNSTAEVQLYGDTLRDIARSGSRLFGEAQVYGVQSRLTQAQRTRASEAFRHCKTGVLVSSDVTARGLDFPDVTHVIQMAAAPNFDQYVHRIGRTGRAGKEGSGYLILSKGEMRRAKVVLRGLPLVSDETFETADLDMTQEANVSPDVGEILSTMQSAFSLVDDEAKSNAYKAMIGVHEADFGADKQELVTNMNNMSRYTWGMTTAPALSRPLVSRMGLGRTEGLNFEERRQGPGGFGGDRRGDRDRGFGNTGRSNGGSSGDSFGSWSGSGGFGSGREGFGRRDGGRGGFGSRDGGRGGFGSRDGGRGGFGSRNGGRVGFGSRDGGRDGRSRY